MHKKSTIIAIIPARGGSKRLPGKNIKLLNKRPMIAYAIKAALSSKYVDKVIVSTDHPKIAKIAEKFGAEVPFVRPKKLSDDRVKTIDVVRHAINFLEKEKKYIIDKVVLIQPTSPLILGSDIDQAIKQQFKTGTASCVSVCPVSERPEWMYSLEKKNPVPLMINRGKKKKFYRLNGAVYVTNRDTIMNKKVIIDNQNLSIIVMPKERSVDIDDIADFKLAEVLMKINNNL